MVSLPGRKIMCNRFSDHDDSLFSQIIHQVIRMDFPLISLGIVWMRLPLWIHYSSREMTSAWKTANIVLNINWMLSTQLLLVQISLGSLWFTFTRDRSLLYLLQVIKLSSRLIEEVTHHLTFWPQIVHMKSQLRLSKVQTADLSTAPFPKHAGHSVGAVCNNAQFCRGQQTTVLLCLTRDLLVNYGSKDTGVYRVNI